MPKCKSLAQCIDQIKIKSKKSLLDPTRILILIYGVSSALEYLHENGIVHGDLSPTTIFLNQSYEPLLSCYGINSINPQRRRLTKSSPQTISMAPELYERLSVPFTMETDIFAFGMFVFRVLSKSIIFQKDASTVSFSDNIISGLRPIIPKWLPPFLKNCIAQCWIQDKEDRPPMSEVSAQLLDGISTFCKGMNEDLFVPYLKKLSHPNLRTNVQPLTPPPRSPSRDFASPIQTVEEAKNSREYSLLFELQNISETGKNLALESMILSNCLLSVNEENKSDCKKWILNNVNFGNDFKVEWLVSNLFKASECRFRNNDNLVMLIKDILDNLDHSKGDNFVSEIQNHFFSEIRLKDPYPSLLPIVDLLRKMVDNHLIEPKGIINRVEVFLKQNETSTQSLLPICCWFAPEIQTLKPYIFKKIMEYLISKCEDVFFPVAYRTFILSYEYYSSDNWKNFRKRISLNYSSDESDDIDCSLEDLIRKDDLIRFRLLTTEGGASSSKRIKPDIFDPCPITHYYPTPKMYAAAYGSYKVFQCIQMNAGNRRNKDRSGLTLSDFAASSGSIAMLRIDDITDHTGALQTAASYHQHSCFRALLKNKNASITKPDLLGRLPIAAAAAANNVQAMIDLIGAGYSLKNSRLNLLNSKSAKKTIIKPITSPFEKPINQDEEKVAVVTEQKQMFGRTPLHEAAEHASYDVLRLLLESGAEVNARDIWGATPLYVAAEAGRLFVVKMLLQVPSINPNIATEDGKTPLTAAVNGGHTEIAVCLLQFRATDPNIADNKGRNALHRACKTGDLRVIEKLVRNPRMNLHAETRRRRTAYDIAVRMERDEVAEIFERVAAEKAERAKEALAPGGCCGIF